MEQNNSVLMLHKLVEINNYPGIVQVKLFSVDGQFWTSNPKEVDLPKNKLAVETSSLLWMFNKNVLAKADKIDVTVLPDVETVNACKVYLASVRDRKDSCNNLRSAAVID